MYSYRILYNKFIYIHIYNINSKEYGRRHSNLFVNKPYPISSAKQTIHSIYIHTFRLLSRRHPAYLNTSIYHTYIE